MHTSSFKTTKPQDEKLCSISAIGWNVHTGVSESLERANTHIRTHALTNAYTHACMHERDACMHKRDAPMYALTMLRILICQWASQKCESDDILGLKHMHVGVYKIWTCMRNETRRIDSRLSGSFMMGTSWKDRILKACVQHSLSFSIILLSTRRISPHQETSLYTVNPAATSAGASGCMSSCIACKWPWPPRRQTPPTFYLCFPLVDEHQQCRKSGQNDAGFNSSPCRWSTRQAIPKGKMLPHLL